MNPSDSLTESVREEFLPLLNGDLAPAQQIEAIKRYLTVESEKIRESHRNGAGGLEVARARAGLIDELIRIIFESNPQIRNGHVQQVALVATGGYGRGTLNPGSDVDLLFLVPRASTSLSAPMREFVEGVLYLLWDVGFKVGHACRSPRECILQAKLDQENKTSLMDARFIIGDRELYDLFLGKFTAECVNKDQAAFFELRRQDIRTRHQKYSHTVFLQEPHVKESCGGLRDYQNIMWVSRVRRGVHDLEGLLEQRLITQATSRELSAAYDFVHRVRNELHFHTGKATDTLTLQLQGVVSTELGYPQRSILKRIEAFMRDFYLHTRHIFRHTTSLMESFLIEEAEQPATGIRSYLTFRKKSREVFDGMIARDGRIYPENQDVFSDDPNRMMRVFQHCQVRHLQLSPQMRRLLAAHWNDIDRPFRYSKANRLTFQSILERRGEAASVLRQMHRIGLLGRYLPEFGALDCLVQHEFFHRYTADEHTLRVIECFDALSDPSFQAHDTFRRLFQTVEDPYAMYLAMILHDTGRAENVREHIDGSAMLAARLCNRLQISGSRRSLILFLVDHHLTMWRTATSRNLEDPEVIAEFAGIVKSRARLDALTVFTFADSNGTSPDAWNGWKEALILQLHRVAHRFLDGGREKYKAALDEDREHLKEVVLQSMRAEYESDVLHHFERMPPAAFRFRQPEQIQLQVRTVRQFLEREASADDPFASWVNWIHLSDKGYSEMVMASRDKPLLLEKVCCALASQEINILSADFFTRGDGVVVNLFRVCTTNFEAVLNGSMRKGFLDVFEELMVTTDYQPEKYFKRKANYLRPRPDQGLSVPVRAYQSNDLHPSCTTLEVQALDRIGLLHDLLHAVNRRGLNTVHARISTEKGVAMDTLYVTNQEGGKVERADILADLESELEALVRLPEVTG